MPGAGAPVPWEYSLSNPDREKNLEAARGAGGNIFGAIASIPVVNRVGQATGLIAPEDKVDEDAIYGSSQTKADDLYARALANAGQNADWQGPAAISRPDAVVAPTITAEGVTAGTVTAPTASDAHRAAPVEHVTAGQVTAPTDVQAQTNVDPTMAGPVRGYSADVVQNPGRAALGPGADQARDDAVGAARGILSAPSAADSQFKSALNKISREQFGMAAQARGAERAGARREAMLGIGQNAIEAADRSAAAAAIEEGAKRRDYAAALQGVRGADVDIAKATGAIDAGNRDRSVAVDSGNAARTTDANAAYAATLNARADLEAGRRTTAAGQNLDRRIALDTGNVDRSVAVQTGNVNRTAAADTVNAGASNTRATNEAQRMTDVDQQNLDRGVKVDTGNVDRSLAAATTTAGARNLAGAQTAQLGVNVAQGNVTASQAQQVAQGSQDINTQQVRQQGQTAGMAAAGNAAQLDKDIASGKAGAAAAQGEREDKSSDRLVTTGTTIGTALSDERVKKDVHGVPDADLADLASKLNAVSFKYKPGHADSGDERHAGVMAQDLERSKLGKELVSRQSDGTRQVDYGQLATLMALAATKSMRKGSAHGTS